jgi:hypothetical protein
MLIVISIPVLLECKNDSHLDNTSIGVNLLHKILHKLHNQRILAQKLSLCVVITVISLAFHKIVSTYWEDVNQFSATD